VSTNFDPRITPARPDLAAAFLKGKVAAERFAAGHAVQVSHGVVDLRAAPSFDAGLQTQLLFGEHFTAYESKDGWVWGQAALDGYVGYARSEHFGGLASPTHRIVSLSSPLLNAPDVKKGARDMLPMNAKLSVAEIGERFVRLSDGGCVFAGHIAPLDNRIPDWVAVAEQFVGVPYVWGGKTSAGIDCSGLVQTALEAGAIKSPRDTDMMEAQLGTSVPLDAGLQRGDLIFWKGHIGLMLDAARIIHANGYFMQVSVEPLALVRERTLAKEGVPVRAIKRL
jgi:cell wall-associated NlpC family hydrolase